MERCANSSAIFFLWAKFDVISNGGVHILYTVQCVICSIVSRSVQSKSQKSSFIIYPFVCRAVQCCIAEDYSTRNGGKGFFTNMRLA